MKSSHDTENDRLARELVPDQIITRLKRALAPIAAERWIDRQSEIRIDNGENGLVWAALRPVHRGAYIAACAPADMALPLTELERLRGPTCAAAKAKSASTAPLAPEAAAYDASTVDVALIPGSVLSKAMETLPPLGAHETATADIQLVGVGPVRVTFVRKVEPRWKRPFWALGSARRLES